MSNDEQGGKIQLPHWLRKENLSLLHTQPRPDRLDEETLRRFSTAVKDMCHSLCNNALRFLGIDVGGLSESTWQWFYLVGTNFESAVIEDRKKIDREKAAEMEAYSCAVATVRRLGTQYGLPNEVV